MASANDDRLAQEELDPLLDSLLAYFAGPRRITGIDFNVFFPGTSEALVSPVVGLTLGRLTGSGFAAPGESPTKPPARTVRTGSFAGGGSAERHSGESSQAEAARYTRTSAAPRNLRCRLTLMEFSSPAFPARCTTDAATAGPRSKDDIA